jgi:hypothetical protein
MRTMLPVFELVVRTRTAHHRYGAMTGFSRFGSSYAGVTRAVTSSSCNNSSKPTIATTRELDAIGTTRVTGEVWVNAKVEPLKLDSVTCQTAPGASIAISGGQTSVTPSPESDSSYGAAVPQKHSAR